LRAIRLRPKENNTKAYSYRRKHHTKKISASARPTIVTGSDLAARNLWLDSSCLISLSILGCTKGSAKSAKVPFAYMIPLLAAGAFNGGGALLEASAALWSALALRTGYRTGSSNNTGSGTCPLWVISRHLHRKRPCPLHPRKRTFAVQQLMSAKGQKRTSHSSFDQLVGALIYCAGETRVSLFQRHKPRSVIFPANP
jgi:hypothetical protein